MFIVKIQVTYELIHTKLCKVLVKLYYNRLGRSVSMLVVVKRAGGGPRPKTLFNAIFVEGKQSYQMLFTRS